MNSFTEILKEVVNEVPGAVGAVFVDLEGEAVGEYSASRPTLEIRIVGAQWGIVWAGVRRKFEESGLGKVSELVIDGEKTTVLMEEVSDEYYVVLTVGKDTHLAKAIDSLRGGAERLRTEM